MEYTVIDIYAGCGTGISAFKKAGFRIDKVVASDNCIELLEKVYLSLRINKFLEWKDNKDTWGKEHYDIVIASQTIPTISFTKVGEKEGINPLWREILEYVRLTIPKIFLLKIPSKGSDVLEEYFEQSREFKDYNIQYATIGVSNNTEENYQGAESYVLGILNQVYLYNVSFPETLRNRIKRKILFDNANEVDVWYRKISNKLRIEEYPAIRHLTDQEPVGPPKSPKVNRYPLPA